MPTITAADGTNLFVRDWGKGRPVILIHGWPLSGDSWSHQALGLIEAGFRVIAYDRRGFGRSDQPGGGYDYDTLSDDLAAIINGLSLSDVALVGFSMGGGDVARYMSRHRGQGVSRIVLVGSVVPGVLLSDANPDGVPAEVFKDIKAGIRKDRAGFFADFFPGFFGQGTRHGGVSEAVIDWSRQVAMQASLQATLDCVDAFGRTDFTGDLPAFNVPVLAIHGTADQNVPIKPTAHRIAKLVPGAELIEYDGAPHGVLETHAARLTDDLIAFLR